MVQITNSDTGKYCDEQIHPLSKNYEKARSTLHILILGLEKEITCQGKKQPICFADIPKFHCDIPILVSRQFSSVLETMFLIFKFFYNTIIMSCV